MAVLRAFRPSCAREPPELIICGSSYRDDPQVNKQTASLIMRAKLRGFHFCFEGERLGTITSREVELSL
jgi:hypothetical protein